MEAGAKIAKSLGVSTELLVFGEDAVEISSELRAIIRIIKRLPVEKQQFLYEIVKLLSKKDL